MISKYDYILWDWNGTLLDDVWLCVDIMNSMLTARSLPVIDYHAYRNIFDFPVRGYYEKAGFNFSEESFEFASIEFCDLYANRVNECDLREDSAIVLEFIKNNTEGQAILSAADQNLLDNMISEFGLRSYFKKIVGQDNQFAISKIEKGKQLVTDLKISPEKIALIGDTTHDAEVAEEIGIDCVLVRHGHHSDSKLESTNAMVVDTLSELVA